MTTFEWFLLIVVVIVVPLIVAVVVTLWTIDQANKRKRANRKDAQIGVKRQAALTPEEVAERKAARARKQEDDMAGDVNINNLDANEDSTETVTSDNGNAVTINNTSGNDLAAADDAAAMAEESSESSADADVIDDAAEDAVEEPNLG